MHVAHARFSQPSFSAIYRRYYDSVWRELARRGVALSLVDDALQDVFVVVHRRLPEFEGRAKLRTWIYEITRRVAMEYRRRAPVAAQSVSGLAIERDTPAELVERKQALCLLQRWLEELDPGKRQAFILAELEQRTAPEIAELLHLNLNTVYARIRAARLHVHSRARQARTIQRVVQSCRSGQVHARRRAWIMLAGRLDLAPASVTALTSMLSKVQTFVTTTFARPTLAAMFTATIGLGTVAAVAPSRESVSPPASVHALTQQHEAASSVGPHGAPQLGAPPTPSRASDGLPRAASEVGAQTGEPVSHASHRKDSSNRAEGDLAGRQPSSRPAAREAEVTPVATPPSLAAQVAALDVARSAVQRGALSSAAHLLERFERIYPDSPLVEEQLKLQLLVACGRGEAAVAERLQRELRGSLGEPVSPCQQR